MYGAVAVVIGVGVPFLGKTVNDVVNPDIPFVSIDGKPVELSFVVGVGGILVLAGGLLLKLVGR